MKVFAAALLVLLALLLPATLSAQEICNNGIDDDGDGLIDLNDPDCQCSTLAATEDLPSYIRNHSFEDRWCCPLSFVSAFGPPYLDCATGWHQATGSTSDYFHQCAYSPAGFNLPPPDGDGAVGFYAMTSYKEYVGTCLTYPLPSNPLIAGTTYTLSLWISGSSTNNQHTQTPEQGQAIDILYPDALPLAIFGLANECVVFPVDVSNSNRDCIGDEPGWNELGRTLVQPSWNWVRVSITFTPTQDIHSIMIGSACDIPASFVEKPFTDSQGNTNGLMPYFVVDELLLTEAQDQVLSPTAVVGNLCQDNVIATAQPPAGATNYQWYLDGVALPGENATTINVSGGGYGAGLYTMAMDFNGQCLMGSAPVAPMAVPVPRPSLLPTAGCAPVTVAFADTTGGDSHTVLWTLGDGTSRSDSAFVHTYPNPGSYDVTLRVQNGAGCVQDTLLANAVIVFPAVNGQINIMPDPVDAEDPVVFLQGSGQGNITSWWWDLGAADPATSDQQALNAFFPAAPGTYPITLVITSEGGCIDTVHAFVRVVDPGVIEMPNVFSPNNDGVGDYFIPLDYKGAKGLMEIYNRWGQLIFTTTNLARGWNGSGAPDGTYFYILHPEEPGATTLTGHVTLVR